MLLLALAGCAVGDKEDETTVPSNVSFGLGIAVPRLLDAGLRFEIADFPPQPAGAGLESYFVLVQTPRAPARVPRGSTISVRVGSSPIPSFGSPINHPATVIVPRLVGLKYTTAMARMPAGLWLQLRTVPPLPSEASVDGLDAFAVARQFPAPGTVMPYGCPRRPSGCRPSTLRIDLRLAD
jgi:hypothetical protein